MSFQIAIDDPRADDVRGLLAVHLTLSRTVTPPEYSFALDVDQLVEPTVTFFSARETGRLVGIAALKRLDGSHAELKSMHTAEADRGRGVGAAMVEHVLRVARLQGYRRVSLETGATGDFVAARTLYTKAGFRPCGPFGDYRPSPYNTFMTISLGPEVDLPDGLACYRDGVDALVRIGEQLGSSDWTRPSACPGWDAATLAGHVLCVARWHHTWLDRAEAGESTLPWPAAELAARNQAALDDLEVVGGPNRLARFRSEASRYAGRLPPRWDLPFAYPGGVVTAGVHAVLAAGEWHLHAWDLGQAIGVEHEADCASVRDQWVALGRSIRADGDPWRALLEASGRRPR